MYIQTFLIYGTGIVALCLIGISIIFIYLYFRVNRAFNALEKEFTQYKQTNAIEAKKELEEAKVRAAKIIDETTLFTNSLKQSFYGAIQKSITSGASTYNSLLSEIQSKTVGEILEINKELKQKADKELQNLSDIAESETKQISEELKKVTAIKQQEIYEKLEASKNQELDSLRQKVLKMFPEVFEEAATELLDEKQKEKVATEAILKIKTKYGL